MSRVPFTARPHYALLFGIFVLSAVVTGRTAYASGPFREACEKTRAVAESTADALEKCRGAAAEDAADVMPPVRPPVRCSQLSAALAEARLSHDRCVRAANGGQAKGTAVAETPLPTPSPGASAQP